jgi:hypothetical protein
MPLLVVTVGFAIAVGVAGTLIPILPGIWLVWVACLGYGLVEGFTAAGWSAMAVITVLAVAGTLAAIVLPQRSAAGEGIARRWQLVAAAAAVVGFFVVPIVGAAIGFVLGIAAGAYAETRTLRRTAAVTLAVLRGLAVGAVAQFVVALAMAGTWAIWVVFG